MDGKGPSQPIRAPDRPPGRGNPGSDADALVARWSHRKDNIGEFYPTDPIKVALEELTMEHNVFLRHLRIYLADPLSLSGTLFKAIYHLGEFMQVIEYLYLLLPDKEDFRRILLPDKEDSQHISELMVPSVIVVPDSNYMKHGKAIYNSLIKLKKQIEKLRNYAHKTMKALARFISPSSKNPDSVFRSFVLRLGLKNLGEDTLTDNESRLVNSQEQTPFPLGNKTEWENLISANLTLLYREVITAWGDGTEKYSSTLKLPCHKQEVSLERFTHRGISVSWRGLNNVRKTSGQIERFKIVLEEFRKQAERYYPEALRILPNLTAWSYNPKGEKTPAASYYSIERQIAFYIENVAFTDGKNEDLPYAVSVIAHEFGHHIFRVQFSQEIRDRLIEVLQPKAYAPISTWMKGLELFAGYGATYATNSFAANWLQKNDPVAYLQLQIASATVDPDYYLKGNRDGSFLWKPEKEQPRHMTVRQLKKLPVTYEVFKWPVTEYGSVNAEETFCEAFSLLIAYGPMAVLEPIREWIYRFIPKLRRNPAARMISNTEVITNTPELQ